ncbi:MAG: cyclic nucleotide-binding domain-containing protein [Endomicrobiales bacterium]|nr:cyclic nucleotide-binding domain-containing protein [Endomicrobiales bacterium]
MELTQQDLQWAKETIMKTGLFTTCSEGQMKQLLDGLDKVHYKANATILFQGEISSKLCLVETGKVSVNVRAGKEKNKVAELGPNTFFGEISLLTPRAATATIKAEEETDVIFLPGEIVQSIVKTDPAFSDFINKKIQERLEAQKQSKEEEEQPQPPQQEQKS